MEIRKFLSAIKDWWSNVKKNTKARKDAQRHEYLQHRSCIRLQMMEFNGKEYISFDGVPVARLENLKSKAPEFLAQAREDFVSWSERFN